MERNWRIHRLSGKYPFRKIRSPWIPLDIRETVFQEKVLQALMENPPGETVSYAQLSYSLGHPKAARAVARACASNRLAVLVPCHRVIRGSGDLAGYKLGNEGKQKLLKQEAREQ